MATSATHVPAHTLAPSNRRLWSGRVLTGAVGLFLLMDTTIHLANIAPVRESSTRLALPLGLAPVIGAVELVCLVAYLLPRTALAGAVLLTGYLGGAVAIQLRAGSPLFAEALFPIYVGILAWVGLLLRRPGLLTVLRSSH